MTVALALDLGGVQAGSDDELAQDVHRAGGLAARDADPVDGGFAVRRGVERAADPFDRLADGPRRRVGGVVPLNVRCSMKWATPASRRSPGAIRPGRTRRWRPNATRAAGQLMTRGPSGSAVRSNIATDGTGRDPPTAAAVTVAHTGRYRPAPERRPVDGTLARLS